MAIDPESHLLLHRLQQRDRDRHIGHILALRIQPDATRPRTHMRSPVPTILRLPRLRRRAWFRRPNARGGSPDVTASEATPTTAGSEIAEPIGIATVTHLHEAADVSASAPC